ncbi:MAG: asparagine synthase (glutamine-hydrolyzing) [Sandaracinaceae bacterium]|nr:asparagine synthase (glutamine-hydrolyzing) [Sandaracinaceae bacterium]
MCGIAGLWGLGSGAQREQARRMADALAHRGPDGSGEWADDEAALALSHRRLSIQDLSDAGAQPRPSRSGRFVITYNGEVYDAGALRRELGGQYRGHSDTEVMLAAFERWGVHEATKRFIGMFAFAVWDAQERLLHLVRDRLGIKPLYYVQTGKGLAFASDLAALEALGQTPGDLPLAIDRDALALYFRYACVPGTRSIYAGVRKVAPGEIVTFRSATDAPRARAYWSALDVIERSVRNPLRGGEGELEEVIARAASTAVRDRLVADVPLGVFLSGGVDSSLVTALMQSQSGSPVKSFSIGFTEGAYDESMSARKIADHLGTDHTELILTPREAMAAIPELGGIYTEPFADSSELPTLLVCRLARSKVTVALSGDGGDEVFGGYNRHLWGPRVWRAMRSLPRGLRQAVARGLRSRSPAEWDAVATTLGAPIRTPGDKAHKLAGLLDVGSADELYTRLTSIWPEPERIVRGGAGAPRRFEEIEGAGLAEQIMARDLASYLPDDILTKVDRASMSIGLEARVPLLDHRLVELAWRLPAGMKIRGGRGKHVLRSILARHVPRELFERPKMGFGVPIDTWLRGPLRDWAETLLDERRLRSEGWLDPREARACWQDHLGARRARQHQLWTILMFQAWLDARRRRVCA